ANGWSEWIDTGVGGAGQSGSLPGLVDGGRQIAAADGRAYVIGNEDKLVVFDPDTLTVSEPITLPINSLEGIVAVTRPLNYDPIPDAPGFFINTATGEIVGPSGTQIDPCQPTLGEIVATQCNSRNVTDIDVSE